MGGITGLGAFGFEVVPKRVHHAPGCYDVIAMAHGHPCDAARRTRHTRLVAQQRERFAEGQFVAVVRVAGHDVVVGTSTTMRTARPPSAEPLPWCQAVGDDGIPHHDPAGSWLYGVEIAVHPGFQRRGIGSALYRARLEVVEELDLEGWYAGGMLMGYHRYADVLSPRAYARQVIDGRLEDPTVSMQMRRGLEPAGIIEAYCTEPKAGDCAVLLVWRPRPLRTALTPGVAAPKPAQPLGHQRAVRAPS